jgi:SOS-response transcriptional repressor LexA
MPGLTKRQSMTLDFIRAFDRQHGYAPSYREIADAIGLKGRSGVHRLIVALEERGFITRGTPYRARSIGINDPAATERERCAEIATRFGRPDIAFAIRGEA